jgi:endonuclease/exonuclease/phosphatase family metal-dependent hydrolase
MTWNIRTGGRDRGGTDRLERVVRVVTAQRPDVLGLQELRDFDRGDRLIRLADATGMRPYLARSCFGQPVAVLVRPPGRVTRVAPVRRPFHHAAQRVVVLTDAGPLTVLTAHLNPYSGVRRLIEAGWLAGALRRASGPMVVLMGDLNSLDPWTDHAERIDRLAPAYRSRHLRRDGRTVDTRTIARLHRAGLLDLFRAATRRGAAPGTPDGEGLTAPTATGGVEFSGMRLDYILGTPPVAALTRDCRVIRGGEAEHASDHYPVVADLALPLG